ncbi:ABC transporter substrate-binding protein [Thermodesulfobacteriota bacterium]
MKLNHFLKRALFLLPVLCFGLVLIGNADAAKTLKIGGTMPLNTGMGTEAKKSWELYVDHINKSGGMTVKGEKYQLKLIIYDDKYTADGGKAGVERLVYRDNCKYIVGMIGSAPTYAAVSVTEQAKALLISGCATDKILQPKFKYTVRIGNLPSVTVARWEYFIKKFPQANTYAMFAPDDESGRFGVKIFTMILGKYNKKLIDTALFPRGTTDFSSIATRIKTANPDFVIFPASRGETDFGLQLKALYEAGYRGIKVAEMFNTDVIKKVATNEHIEGVMAPVNQSDLQGNRRNKSSYLMEKLYKEKYGSFNTSGPIWVKGLNGFLAAVKKADSLKVDDILAAFNRLEFEHPEGKALMVRRADLGLDRYCDTVLSMEFGIVKNGKVVHDESISTSQVIKACETVFGGTWK